MRIEFTEEGHTYCVDGEAYPSVTQILSAEGLSDYQFCKESHRDRGILVHDITVLIDQGWPDGIPPEVKMFEEIVEGGRWDIPSTSPELRGYGYAYCWYLFRAKPKWMLIEQPVASKIYRFAGRFDRYGETGLVRDSETAPKQRGMVLADIKSGDPGSSASIQEALYGLALEETFGLKADETTAIWLRPNGTFKCIPGTGKSLRVGTAALTLYWHRKENNLFK